MAKPKHAEKKAGQQDAMLHKYIKINELSKGEFFKKMKELEKVKSDLDALNKKKSVLKMEVQAFISGKAILEKAKNS